MASVKQTSKNPNYQLPITKYRPLLQLHSNQTGAISVLVLLTIWCLVAMVAMIWNTSEIADRRQLMQNAADSAAHATATLYARTTNAVAAQNMIIAQDGAAEVVWRAVPPTYTIIDKELKAELAFAQAMLSGKDPSLNQLRGALIQKLQGVDDEYVQVQNDYDVIVAEAPSQKFPDKKTAAEYSYKLREAGDALSWLSNTYVNGGAPMQPQFPGPPGGIGIGLRQLVVQKSTDTPLNDKMLEAVINSIVQQEVILESFKAQTDPATSEDLPTIVDEHEQKVFDTETQMVDQLTQAIEDQRSQLATFYKTDISLANLEQQPLNELYAAVQPGPVMAADDAIGVEGHMDSIRARYPDEATKEGLSIEVRIDPINPHTDQDRVWYPNQIQVLPDEDLPLLPVIPKPSFTVNCNVPGGWGHSYGFPIEKYLSDRVWKDQANLKTDYMIPIDKLRQQLAITLSALAGIPPAGIPYPPKSVVDNIPDPISGAPGTIDVLPQITAPANATADYRTAVKEYNQHASRYLSRVRDLATALGSYGSFFNRFTEALAQRTWFGQIVTARMVVLQELAATRRFMVLASYQLHAIPDWAKSGMYQSTVEAVYDRIISQNTDSLAASIRDAMVNIDPRSLHLPKRAAQAAYSPDAAKVARDISVQVAQRVSPEIAAELLSREWPYEMAPPLDVVPPSRGMGMPDRQRYFSVIAGARENDASTPKLLLPWIFNANATKITAIAQAESINWMEYNSSYGGSEFFDSISSDGYGEFLLCPRAWRLSTIGGWNWQPRIALSDMLSQALEQTQELPTYMQDAGVKGTDQDALNVVNVH